LKRTLIAAIACRNEGSRLYGKPLQNLDVYGKRNILQNIIINIKKINVVEDIVLGIAKENASKAYEDFAKKHKIKFIYGDKIDVLSRLIKCGNLKKATDILRITSESPYPYLDNFNKFWINHVKKNFDATFLDEVVDGCGFEIIKLTSLVKSHKFGKKKHRSELCSLYIRENKNKFSINKIKPPKYLIRKDLRLTVDYPEDLVVCREIFSFFKNKKINHKKIIKFLDKNKKLKDLVKKYTYQGYKTMYK